MKNRTKPMRRCIGCMESKPKEALVRVTWYEGRLAVDLTGKAKGRGVYICRDRDCIAKAIKKGAFARSLRVDPGREQVEAVCGQLEALAAEEGDSAKATEPPLKQTEGGTNER